jgi:hypothetical protein
VERRLGDDAPEVADEFLVRAGTEWAALLGSRPIFAGDGLPLPLEVERRAGPVPVATDAGQTVAPSGEGGDGLAYRLGLLGTKGRSARQREALSSARYSAGTFSSEGVAARTMFTSVFSTGLLHPLGRATHPL